MTIKLLNKCTYQRPSRGVEPGEIRGHSAGYADFCRQFFCLGRGHWTAFALPRQDKRGRTRGICNIAAILKNCRDWVLAVSVSYVSLVNLTPFAGHHSLT